jgi:hypothetical protein
MMMQTTKYEPIAQPTNMLTMLNYLLTKMELKTGQVPKYMAYWMFQEIVENKLKLHNTVALALQWAVQLAS